MDEGSSRKIRTVVDVCFQNVRLPRKKQFYERAKLRDKSEVVGYVEALNRRRLERDTHD